MTATLTCRGLSVNFGGVKAVSGLELDVGRGQLVALIGPNGAGKTTSIDALTGFVPAAGRIELDGRAIASLPPHARARRGLVRTWQSIMLFDDLTVRENLAVAASRPSVWEMAMELLGRPPRSTRAVESALARLGLEDVAEAMPSELSQGRRKLVGVARALVADPHVVCLDEPAAGLDTWESRQLGEQLRAIADRGTGILLVDHDMGLVLEISDWVVVLEFGEVIAAGPPDAIRSDPRVIEAYLGASAASEVGAELKATTATGSEQ
jgi:ABC-type branched-subunit amino acid transport system ATPase component